MPDEFMRVKDCNEKHRETMDVLNAINDRLYRDNGQKSIQSRLNDQETTIKNITENQKKMDGALTRLFWTIATPLIGGSLWVCWIGVKYLITTGKL